MYAETEQFINPRINPESRHMQRHVSSPGVLAWTCRELWLHWNIQPRKWGEGTEARRTERQFTDELQNWPLPVWLTACLAVRHHSGKNHPLKGQWGMDLSNSTCFQLVDCPSWRTPTSLNFKLHLCEWTWAPSRLLKQWEGGGGPEGRQEGSLWCPVRLHVWRQAQATVAKS